ncbi:MAG TPA: peroxiredoxin [Candidatus Saccharimonadales bacterium]|nr:peroxiredoxin [Candidatus Saccharimonadales bacterium]
MQKAYNFSLPDQTGKVHSLEDYKGSWLVLYFYPKDETPGCTLEACTFRDGRDDLKEAGAEVVGISKDSVASHKKFMDAHSLNFTLLSDESTETIKAFNAWGKNRFGHEGTLRKTFLINPEGEIAKEYGNVSPTGHADKVLGDLRALQEK